MTSIRPFRTGPPSFRFEYTTNRKPARTPFADPISMAALPFPRSTLVIRPRRIGVLSCLLRAPVSLSGTEKLVVTRSFLKTGPRAFSRTIRQMLCLGEALSTTISPK
jgi:hypothetical protein